MNNRTRALFASVALVLAACQGAATPDTPKTPDQPETPQTPRTPGDQDLPSTGSDSTTLIVGLGMVVIGAGLGFTAMSMTRRRRAA